MTKKDYIKIAALLKQARADAYEPGEDAVVDILSQRFADMLQQDNPLFDRKRFLEASR